MLDYSNLKQCYHAGEPIHQKRIPNNSTVEQIQAAINKSQCDMLYIDAQHSPITDWDIVRICQVAEEHGIPVQLRIKHTLETHLIGRYLDLGVFAIKVPEVKFPETVEQAVNAFYFPPVGQRSWGGTVGFGIQPRKERLAYAQWWNTHGILGFKIESVHAVLNIRSLVKPGIDYVDFGPSDLSFDLETHPHSQLKTLDDCKAYVQHELQGVDVRVL